MMWPEKPTNSGFTLIELLIGIAVVALLSTVTVITINPSELLKRSRDTQRLQEIETLNKALALYSIENSSAAGDEQTVYVSIPDNSATCANLTLPALPSDWSYACVASSTFRNVDGTGWIPVNLQGLSFQPPIASLPIDVTNNTSGDLYFRYARGASTKYELSSAFESATYGFGGTKDRASTDGGTNPGRYETGLDVTLDPINLPVTEELKAWFAADNITGLANGEAMSSWGDLSGNGNNVSQGSEDSQPTYRTNSINGNPAVLFDGSNDFLYLASVNNVSSDAFTMVATIRPTTLGGSDTISIVGGSGDCGSGGRQLRLAGGVMQVLKSSVASMGTSLTTMSQNNNYIVGFIYGSPNGSFYLNGSADGTLSSTQTFGNSGLLIGGRSCAEIFKGYIAEFLYYDKTLSANEFAQVNAYLSSKYGI